MNTESHRFKVTLSSLLFNYFVVFVFCLVAIFLIFFVVLDPAQEARWFAGLWSVSVLPLALPNALRTPHPIVLDESGELSFKSLLSKRGIPGPGSQIDKGKLYQQLLFVLQVREGQGYDDKQCERPFPTHLAY